MIRIRLFSSLWIVSAVILVLSLTFGCSEDPARKPVVKAAKKAKPQIKPSEVQQVSEPEEEVPKKFVYSPTGRRDPFEPLVKKGEKKRTSTEPLTPLQRFDLGQFRLQAVLIGKGAPRAMVSAPDGKTYILSPGIKIGKREGVVTAITRESVQVEEVHYDLTGEVTRKQASIDLPEQKSF